MDAKGDVNPNYLLWSPSDVHSTQMDRFRRLMNEKKSLKLNNYHDLYQWSLDRHAEFWEEFWQYSHIIYSTKYDQVLDTSIPMDDIPEWFKGSRLNYAQNLLDKGRANDVAIYFTSEGRDQITEITFAELREHVRTYAAALRHLGVVTGNRVVGYIPNCPEAVYAMLATASIGAIWSSASPDFGVSGVLDRFRQIHPKVIFSVNAVIYNAKQHYHLDKLDQVVKGLPDLEKVVVIPFVEGNIDLSSISNSCTLDEFIRLSRDANARIPELKYEQLPFNHPLFIMYSSGTTGPPKCMVHSAGGTLIQHLKEHMLHGDMSASDRLLYYTTTGWMMWNWMVSGLGTGAALVLYDGSPFIPNTNLLWRLIDQTSTTIFGTSAKWLAVCEEKDIKPGELNSLKTLRAILSTGSPLKPESFDYIYRDVKQDILVGSITGGTDLISCFAGSNPVLPVYRGEIQSPNLGMAIQCWDKSGCSVTDTSGELVCVKPFPSMPTSFWNDPERLLYKKAYFSCYKGIWAHGDYCSISSRTGGVTMLGRSDGTLNPCGVRFGSAEIYSVVESFKEIEDSLCVGQRSVEGNEERVILFVKMTHSDLFSHDLVKRIKVCIRSQLSARHVPAMIVQVADIPYTHNGKKVEVCVKKVLRGEKVLNRGAYANPDSLDLYSDIPELRHW